MIYFHGGHAGLPIGGVLVPSAPHVTDGCPICVARAKGMTLTVGEYRAWARSIGPAAEPVLRQLAGEPDDAIIDPPSQEQAVYLTTDREYARFHAARSEGDLYQVEPIGQIKPSTEDHFPSFVVQSAAVVKVIERGVKLRRRDRRHLLRRWGQADKAHDRRAKEEGPCLS